MTNRKEQMKQLAAIVQLQAEHPELKDQAALASALNAVGGYLISSGKTQEEVSQITSVKLISKIYVEQVKGK